MKNGYTPRRKFVKGIKALLGFPFYVYKINQKVNLMEKELQTIQGSFRIEGNRDYFIDIESLQSTGSNDIESMYKDIFVREVNPVKLYSQSPIILDCGANVGMFSLYCKYLYPNSKIYAYEPDPVNFNDLKYNLKGHVGIILSNNAIGSKNETIRFYSEGTGASSLFDNSTNLNNRKEVEVNSNSLKDIIKEQVKIDLLKLDIEGAEVDALHVCDGALGNVEQIIVEYHDLKSIPNRLSKLLSLLERNNFIYNISCDNIVRSMFDAINNSSWNMNFIVCIHAVQKSIIESHTFIE